MTRSAGLSRAYATLKQLELLKRQDILDPLPQETDIEDDEPHAQLEPHQPSHGSAGPQTSRSCSSSPLAAATVVGSRPHHSSDFNGESFALGSTARQWRVETTLHESPTPCSPADRSGSAARRPVEKYFDAKPTLTGFSRGTPELADYSERDSARDHPSPRDTVAARETTPSSGKNTRDAAGDADSSGACHYPRGAFSDQQSEEPTAPGMAVSLGNSPGYRPRPRTEYGVTKWYDELSAGDADDTPSEDGKPKKTAEEARAANARNDQVISKVLDDLIAFRHQLADDAAEWVRAVRSPPPTSCSDRKHRRVIERARKAAGLSKNFEQPLPGLDPRESVGLSTEHKPRPDGIAVRRSSWGGAGDAQSGGVQRRRGVEGGATHLPKSLSTTNPPEAPSYSSRMRAVSSSCNPANDSSRTSEPPEQEIFFDDPNVIPSRKLPFSVESSLCSAVGRPMAPSNPLIKVDGGFTRAHDVGVGTEPKDGSRNARKSRPVADQACGVKEHPMFEARAGSPAPSDPNAHVARQTVGERGPSDDRRTSRNAAAPSGAASAATTSTAVSSHTKSLLRQHRDRHRKTLEDIQWRKAENVKSGAHPGPPLRTHPSQAGMSSVGRWHGQRDHREAGGPVMGPDESAMYLNSSGLPSTVSHVDFGRSSPRGGNSGQGGRVATNNVGLVDTGKKRPPPHQTGVRHEPLQTPLPQSGRTASGTLNDGAPTERVPLMQHLTRLQNSGSVLLVEELRRMESTCCTTAPNGVRDWVALTTMINQPGSIRNILVPLFVAEMEDEAVALDPNAGAPDSRASHLLCALIGFGALAEAALQTLLGMLERQVGDFKLVTLAIRAVGGDEGQRALCDFADTRFDDPILQAAALYGLGILGWPVLGHTTVCCVGVPEMKGKVVFYQPPVDVGYRELSAHGGDSPHMSLQRSPLYRPTNVFLDCETVRRRLLRYVLSSKFRVAKGYDALPTVLADYLRDGPVACDRLNVPLSGIQALVGVLHEAHDVIGEAPGQSLVIPYSFDPYLIGRDDDVFRIEETLVSAMVDGRNVSGVVEQALVSIASLPRFMTSHVAEPLLDLVVKLADRFDECTSKCSDDNEAVLVAGCVALGRLARDSNVQDIVDTSSAVLIHLLHANRWKIRHGACIGLGEIGALSANVEAVADALSGALENTSVSPETVAWALARHGYSGITRLLGFLRQRSLSLSARVACARAIGSVDAMESSNSIVADAERIRLVVPRSLSDIIASDAGEGVEEEALLDCVYSLAAFTAANSDEAVRHACEASLSSTDEASLYYRTMPPSSVFDVLKRIVEAAVLPFSVQKALFHALCQFGGGYGELYASQTAVQCPVVTTRAAAAFGIRACGAKTIRTIAMALNDDSAEVRVEAFDTLDSVGVAKVVDLLKQRPHQHTQQVVIALRDCLLRDINKNVKRQVAQELYSILSRTPLVH